MQITGIAELDTRIGKARAAMQALHYSVVLARSQKFEMGRLFGGSGGFAPSARKFCIFLQK